MYWGVEMLTLRQPELLGIYLHETKAFWFQEVEIIKFS